MFDESRGTFDRKAMERTNFKIWKGRDKSVSELIP